MKTTKTTNQQLKKCLDDNQLLINRLKQIKKEIDVIIKYYEGEKYD